MPIALNCSVWLKVHAIALALSMTRSSATAWYGSRVVPSTPSTILRRQQRLKKLGWQTELDEPFFQRSEIDVGLTAEAALEHSGMLVAL
jgi:hypothetical protein